MTHSHCPVCAGIDVKAIASAVGERAYCHSCFHGWRTSINHFNYTATAMCSLGTADERLKAQADFVAPFCSSGANILEIGCATGELAAIVRKTMQPARYEAIELSPAGQHAKPYLDRLHTVPLTDLLAAGEIDRDFDVILMSHVLEHLEDPAAELRAMKSVLRGRGVIFLEVPNMSGHRRLPIDDNRSHLHFFSPSSLSRLLAIEGFEVVAAATGAWLDERYADSFRVVAKAFALPEWNCHLLSDHPLIAAETSIIVWGAGSLADEMLANFFDAARIDFFIDRDPKKHGNTLLGRPILAPEALGGEARTVLINSIDFAPAIMADLKALYPDTGHRLIPISDLLI
jgi:2-polyprenyl-3-methyl-5-hydroxy-6-metoxy-1,4-benzoquinol methylase